MRRWRVGSSASQPFRKRLWLTLLALAVTSLAGRVFADAAPRVALVTSDPTTTTAMRLRAELRGLGVEVVVVPVEENVPLAPAALEQLARTDGAFAAVRVVRVASEVEVWIADRVTGKTVVRDVSGGSGDTGSRDDTIAVKTVELLRASLLEVTVEPETKHGDLPPPPVVTRILRGARQPTARRAEPALPWFSLGVGPAMDLGIGGLGPSFAVESSARWQSKSVWGLAALGAIPVNSATVSRGAIASAEFRLYRAGLAATVSARRGPLEPVLALGVELVHLQLSRVAAQPGYEVNQREGAWAVAPCVEAGLGVELVRYLRVRGDLGLLVTQPITVEFATQRVARWGLPALTASLALEVLIPPSSAASARRSAQPKDL